jgi:hypothetical protein
MAQKLASPFACKRENPYYALRLVRFRIVRFTWRFDAVTVFLAVRLAFVVSLAALFFTADVTLCATLARERFVASGRTILVASAATTPSAEPILPATSDNTVSCFLGISRSLAPEVGVPGRSASMIQPGAWKRNTGECATEGWGGCIFRNRLTVGGRR